MPKLIVCAALLFSCTQKEPALYASSAGDATYAERYPAMLAALRNGHSEAEQRARTTTGEFPKYPDELKEPSWSHVQATLEKADQAGKSADFAAGAAETEVVQRFYAEERDTLRQRAGGAAEHVAKEKQCQVELYGPVGGALDRAMQQRLEERLRQRSAAHRYIEDHEDAIGKANREKLEKQADEVALASHIVHVRLPNSKREIEARLADASGVKDTLERTQEETKAVLADPGSSKAAKQLAEKRAQAAAAAQASLDSEVSQAKALADELERRTKTAADEYEKAFDALIDAVEAKAKDTPPPAPPKS